MFLQVLIARPGRWQNGQLAHKVRKTMFFSQWFFDHPENPQEAIQAKKVNFILFLQCFSATLFRRQNGQLAHKVRKTMYFTVFC